jgi:DNA-directed DNA polymerase III PolC
MFVHLHCHSHYSFLRGVNPPEEIIAAAVEQKMPAVALTDTNGMYAAVPFYQAAKAAGIKPIVGVVLDVEWPFGETPDSQVTSRTFRKAKIENQNPSSVPMVLLAMDAAGYSNLCQLTTLRHLGVLQFGQQATFAGDNGRPITLEELAVHSARVIALCPATILTRSEVTEEGKAAARGFAGGTIYNAPTLARLKEIFGDRLYLEIQHLSPGDGRTLREAERVGRALNIPLVATNTVYFLKPEEHLHHRAVNAIRTNGLLTTVEPPEITTPEAWFKSAAEMQRLFPDHPELLQNTLEIAAHCNLQLELGKLIFPEFPVPEGESAFSYLWKLAFAGAQKRYRPLRPAVLSRLTHELEVIDKLNLAPYFLLVWDIVEEAHRRGIPAVARGSAASSMVTYCLGISCVCPLRWGLYFERFLNVERGDCPDIDIDICGARRDELLDYVYTRWGAEHVAMIGSFITMHARLAVREIAKVFGVPPGEVNHFTKRLPHRPVREILNAIQHLPQCRDLPVNDEPWKTILHVGLRLDDAPRHLGIHPCGTVISARPLAHLVPLERATKGIVVTQYDMNAIEALGLIKMDLLGQRGFTTMALALDNIEKSVVELEESKRDPSTAGRENHRPSARDDKHSLETTVVETNGVAPDGVTPCPRARTIDFDAIPENDPATCEVVAAGRTMGLFQIESPAMRGLLRMMKARTLEQMAQALALIRPGAAEYGSKELFIRRLRGQEPVVYPHESLESILGDTLGVCIFQEQVMQIARAVGSMTLAEADLVRRTSTKYSGQRDYNRLRAKFEKAAEKMGLTNQQRDEAWTMVEKFAGFGFCKAHAATYADISYRMTYLKTHHTAEFLAAMCSAGAGFYHVSAYVEEAKRWGIEVRLPSVNRSRMEYTTEAVTDVPGEPCAAQGLGKPFETQGKPFVPQGKRALRIGLMQVRGLRVETIVAIARARETHGVFHSLQDFLARIPAERDEIEALIKCGAFDDVCNMTRPAMLWQWNLLQAKHRQTPVRQRAASAAAATSNGVAVQAQASVLFADMKQDDAVAMALRDVPAADYTVEQKLRYEREILEVCVSGHPLDFLPRNGEVWSDELPQLHGKRVTLCGWVVTYRHVGTKNYRNMMFLTLEDQRSLYEVILFPDTYDKYGGLIYETRAMRVIGMVQDGEHINAEHLERLRAE